MSGEDHAILWNSINETINASHHFRFRLPTIYGKAYGIQKQTCQDFFNIVQVQRYSYIKYDLIIIDIIIKMNRKCSMMMLLNLIIALQLSICSEDILKRNLEMQQKIRQYQLKIADEDGNIIFPFYQSEREEYHRCGAVSSLKFYNQQVLYIQANRPFIANMFTQSNSLKVSGYAESTQSEGGKHIGLMIITQQCNNYFTQQKYTSYMKIYPSKNSTFKLIEESPDHYLTAQISSIAYCLSELQLKSLEQAFNVGYSIMLLVVASMLPTFPFGKLSHKIILMILLLISQLKDIQRALFILLSCLLVIINPLNRNQLNLEVQTQKAYKLFKSSLISMFLFYFLMYLIIYFSRPTETSYIQQQSSLYTAQLYIQNSIEMLIILQLFSSVVWINRLRSFFWWTVIVMFVYLTWIKDSSLVNEKSYIFGVILPSIFTQRCQYRSMILNILLMPICQYMDRFHKVKFGGLLLMVSLSIFGVYSDVLALFVSGVIVIFWFCLGISQEGYLTMIKRRWLSLPDIQVIQR